MAEVVLDGGELARRHASYVLDWLRQSGAPALVIETQERVVELLGGYVHFRGRVFGGV